MPSFCRHNRLIQNCPICSREQAVEMRPVVSSSAPAVSQPRPAPSSPRRPGGRTGARAGGHSGSLRVRRLARAADDGYTSSLLPGLRSSEDAAVLAEEIAFAALRLEALAEQPWDLYAEAADPAGDLDERTWLVFQIVCLAAADPDDYFAAVMAARTAWASGENPVVEAGALGPRATRSPDRVFAAYRGWAARAGSQAAALSGESAWTPARRFARVYERLALPGLDRAPRFELLAVLGALGLYELTPEALALGGDNEVTLAAKRALGIGDVMLLERRSAELAAGVGVPIGALDLGLRNWGSGTRETTGFVPEGDMGQRLERRTADIRAALSLED